MTAWSKPAGKGSRAGGGTNVPGSVKCHVGGEWRPSAHFSQRQQGRYTGRAHDSGMTCLHHSGQIMELACAGPCRQTKPLASFSKNTRSKGDVWCKECTAWAESQENGVVPWAAPGNDLSYDEHNSSTSESDISEVYVATSVARDTPLAPVSGELGDFISSAQVDSPELTFNMSSIGSTLPSRDHSVVKEVSKVLYPHIRHGSEQGGTGEGSQSAKDTAAAMEERIMLLPPHIREKARAHIAAAHVAATPNVNKATSTEDYMPPHLRRESSEVSFSTATTMREAQAGGNLPGVAFNAWDGAGQRHNVLKVLSVQSTHETLISFSDDEDEPEPPTQKPTAQKPTTSRNRFPKPPRAPVERKQRMISNFQSYEMARDADDSD